LIVSLFFIFMFDKLFNRSNVDIYTISVPFKVENNCIDFSKDE